MTMTKMPLNVVQFANNDPNRLSIYEGMRDLYFHALSEDEGRNYGNYDKSVSLAEKDEKLSKHIFSEIETLSKTPMGDMNLMVWATNPSVKWAVDATRNAIIEAIIPDAIIRSIGIYTDIENVEFGQTATFDIKPNSLMSTSKSGNSQRTAWVQKQFDTSVTLTPVNHDITVQASFYKVLAGKESLADFMRKAVVSIERDMSKDAYAALTGLLSSATFPTALKKTGYTAANLLNLCQTVTAYNQGNKAVIVGTTQALSTVFPSSSDGYRVVTDANNMSIQLIKNFYDYDTLVLPQVASGSSDFGLTLNDNQIYVISPSSDKIVKGNLYRPAC